MTAISCWTLVVCCLVIMLVCLATSISYEDFRPCHYGSSADTALTPRLGVDELSSEVPLPKTCSNGMQDEFVEEIYRRNEDVGQVFQQEIIENIPDTSSMLQGVAQKVEEQVVAASSPSPPNYEPLALDVLPQKYWQPVFLGCQSTFTNERCDFSYPTPRLWVPNLNELQYARSLEQGRTNLIEPLEARQALAQLLSVGVRRKRDVYTQATPANDIASQSPCAQLKKQSPSFVWR